MMDAFTDPSVEEIDVMSSAQIGKTEFILNIVGYVIDREPGPILIVQPTLEMGEAFSKDRLAPMMRDTEQLAGKFDGVRAKDGSNTLLHKQFPGGHVTIAGANSPASLASRPIRIVLADEVDKYPASAGVEGDPLALADKRTTTFWNKKRVRCSTPTIKDLSRIESAFKESDQRFFYVPCAHCGEAQTLVWTQVKFDEHHAEKASYCCAICGALWTEAQRAQAVRGGEWRASKPFRGIAGFHISELYSPWVALATMVRQFIDARAYPERLKTWTNVSLGLPYEETQGVSDPAVLRDRAEDYELGVVPAEAVLVTMGVDVQSDRLEAYTWAFGPGEEMWCINFRGFYGDPARPVVWDQLLEHIGTPLQHELGMETIPRTVAIDSGGHHTQVVYAFCRRHAMRNAPIGKQQIIAIKGQSEATSVVLGSPKPQDVTIRGEKIKKGIHLWPVGSSQCKVILYGRLSIETPGPGFVHTSKNMQEDFWEQLISEKLLTRYIRGYPKQEWHLPDGKRNEALDCAVYAYAAAAQLGMLRYKPNDWVRLKTILLQRLKIAEAKAEQPQSPQQQPVNKPPLQRMAQPRPNWTTNWRG